MKCFFFLEIFSVVDKNAKASYDFSSNDPYPYPRYTDDGKTVDGPRNATMRAIVRGVNEVCFFVLF